MNKSNKKAVVLLSGGLDSATTLYFAKEKGFDVKCLIFDYGQRHKKEINSAKKIAEKAGCKYWLIKIKLPWKGSALLDNKIKIPLNSLIEGKKIPATYVPSRNIIFLSFASSFAESIGAGSIFIGANAIDYSGYPDCRPEFLSAFQKVIHTGTKKKYIKLIAPLINKTKAQIVKIGKALKVPHELTWSCYLGGKKPCGKCDSCLLRDKGFKQAGVKDPLLINKEKNFG